MPTKKTDTYTTSSLYDCLTDEHLEAISNEIQRVRSQRIKRRNLRKNWITAKNIGYFEHPNATTKTLGDLVIVTLYNRNSGCHIGTARPVEGDTFDKATGIAVAFAKACGETIPDYI
jgi:hypothetical protein